MHESWNLVAGILEVGCRKAESLIQEYLIEVGCRKAGCQL
jgi:hypothetical protein